MGAKLTGLLLLIAGIANAQADTTGSVHPGLNSSQANFQEGSAATQMPSNERRLQRQYTQLQFSGVSKPSNLTVIRDRYRIPALGAAVVGADTTLLLQLTGVKRIDHPEDSAGLWNLFHLGSNTKAITSLLAARLVAWEGHNGGLRWNTKFFELFPEFEKGARKCYRDITLRDLLSFRGLVQTYSYNTPQPKAITGTAAEQREAIVRHFLKQPPMKQANGLTPSNVDYIMATMMLEKSAGRDYRRLMEDLGLYWLIRPWFGYPNNMDTLETWGHDTAGQPVPPRENMILERLLGAGNICMELPEYAILIKEMLRGREQGLWVPKPGQPLQNNVGMTPDEVDRLFRGLPGFALGWFNDGTAGTEATRAWNTGNAGAFTSMVEVDLRRNIAIIILANTAEERGIEGMTQLMEELKERYFAQGPAVAAVAR